MSTISQLAKFPKVEVLINMMINTAKRFAGKDIIDDNFDELFGSSTYHQCTDLQGEQRQRCLHDLYEAELRTQGQLKYVWSFSMFNRQNQRSYYLFHGCQHIRGLEIMKDAMWKVDPAKGSEFRDIHAGVDVLFSDEPRYDLLAASLVKQFGGQAVSISTIEDWVTVHTPFKKNGHLKKPVLKPMEEAGQISVTHYPKENRRGCVYIDGTVIEFSEKPE